jgi:hypothetical protein
VVDVPTKLASRARMLDIGHGRKTDAHSVAIAGVRSEGVRVLAADLELEVLRMPVDRREEVARQRNGTGCAAQRIVRVSGCDLRRWIDARIAGMTGRHQAGTLAVCR